jgi:ankyrin repeat protein
MPMAIRPELDRDLLKAVSAPLNGASGNFLLKDRVEGLLKEGADVEARDGEGMTPLMWAARNYRTKIFQSLLDAGADIFAEDNEGRTALDHARKAKRKPAVQLLSALQDSRITEKGTPRPLKVGRPLKLRPPSGAGR